MTYPDRMSFQIVATALHLLADAVPGSVGELVHAEAEKLLAAIAGEAVKVIEHAAGTAPADSTPGDTSAVDDAYARGWQAGYQTGWTDCADAAGAPGPVPAIPPAPVDPSAPAGTDSPAGTGQPSELPSTTDAPVSGGPETEPAPTDSPTAGGAPADQAP